MIFKKINEVNSCGFLPNITSEMLKSIKEDIETLIMTGTLCFFASLLFYSLIPGV